MMQSKYNWGLYSDPNDPRFVVPKLNPALGWTVNIAHPQSRLALILIGMVVVAGLAGSVLLG